MIWKNIEGKEFNKIEDFPQNCYGFIYKITHKETGKIYIGKKQLVTKKNKLIGKKELRTREIQPGRIPKKKLIISESNWNDYYGSSKNLLLDIKKQGKDKFERIILQLAYTSKLLNYYEVLYQMKYDVLNNENSYNDNIAGKFFRKDFLIINKASE